MLQRTTGRGSGGQAVLHKLRDREYEIWDICDFWIFSKFKYFNFFIIVGIIYFKPKNDKSHYLELLQNLLDEFYIKVYEIFKIICI